MAIILKSKKMNGQKRGVNGILAAEGVRTFASFKRSFGRKQRYFKEERTWLQHSKAPSPDLIGEHGLLKQLSRALVERVLQAVRAARLGHSKHELAGLDLTIRYCFCTPVA